ncbi:hypothetical protein COCAGNCG_02822 [Aeromonas dhakensis]
MVAALTLVRILTGWPGITSVSPGGRFFAPAKE